jgi:hypothetical protein
MEYCETNKSLCFQKFVEGINTTVNRTPLFGFDIHVDANHGCDEFKCHLRLFINHIIKVKNTKEIIVKDIEFVGGNNDLLDFNHYHIVLDFL